MACWISFYREVEADSPERALQIDHEEPGVYLGCVIGDELSGSSSRSLVVDQLPTDILKDTNVQLPERQAGENPGD